MPKPSLYYKLPSIRKFAVCLVTSLFLFISFSRPLQAQCGSLTSPITTTDQTSLYPQSKVLSGGLGTTVDNSVPGIIHVDVSNGPRALIILSFSAGGVLLPSLNTFTAVSNASQINLPGSTVAPVGSVIGLTLTGTQASTSVVTNYGAANENIVFAGNATNHSIVINNGDQIYFLNQGGGTWLVSSFVPQGGSQGSNWSIAVGGTGASTQQTALNNIAGPTNPGDIMYLTGAGTWAHLAIGQGIPLLMVQSGSPSWATAGGNYFGSGVDGDAVINSAITVGDGTSDNDFVTMNYNNLTINSGGSLTTQVRKFGLLVYVRGNCTINSGGLLHMNAKGAAATASAATSISKLQGPLVTSGTFSQETSNQQNLVILTPFTSALAGGTAGAGGASGANGSPGGTVASGTGGGGGGGACSTRLGAAGAAGTAYCGGSAGGGASGTGTGTASGGTSPTAGATQGGSGGSGGTGQNGTNAGGGGGGGGAGNADGSGGAAGTGGSPAGTAGITPTGGGGGTLILIVGGNLTVNGTISANGANGGNGGTGGSKSSGTTGGGGAGGGGAGGGRIICAYSGTYTNNTGSIQANGGTGGTGGSAGGGGGTAGNAGKNGGNGGNGAVTGPVQILPAGFF